LAAARTHEAGQACRHCLDAAQKAGNGGAGAAACFAAAVRA
jgi:hypothetical protein